MAAIFAILAIVLGLADFYIFAAVVPQWPLWLKVAMLLPTAAYAAATVRLLLGDVRQSALNWLLWLMLCVVFTTLIFCAVSIVGKGVALLWPPAAEMFNIVAAALGAVWLAVALYGIARGWKRITVDELTISSPKIPERFNDYKIVQLSDFHIGTYAAAPETVKKIVDEVNSLSPDLIVFTGDLVNSHSEEIGQFKEMLSQLKAKDGVYSVLGNHDYCLYRNYTPPETPAKELARVISAEGEIGWRLLRNESVRIKRGNSSIALAGVDNAGSRMFPNKSDLAKATKGLRSDEFKILLSHDPSHWRREVLPASDVDLTLSGHTHAMQFKIANWSPAQWVYREWGGLYKQGDRQLFVSTGIGENVAFRFGAYPQIVLITLSR